MNTFLFISRDVKTIGNLEKSVTSCDFSFKNSSTLSAALESCKALHFKFVLIDLKMGTEEQIKDFCHELWKAKPMAIVGVHDYEPSYMPYSLQILGVRPYLGEDADQKLELDLEQLSAILEEPGTNSILYVEDLDAPRFIIGSLMESFNLGRVTPVASAPEGLEVLEQNPTKHYCVVTDLNMPEFTGLWLLRQIRETPHLSSLPVILITAYGTQETLIECLKEGATGFLVKPPRREQLKEELNKARRIHSNGLSPRLASPDSVKEMENLLKIYSK